MEAVIEEAAEAVRVDVAGRFLGKESEGGRGDDGKGDEFAVNAQCDWSPGLTCEVATSMMRGALTSRLPPLDSVYPHGAV